MTQTRILNTGDHSRDLGGTPSFRIPKKLSTPFRIPVFVCLVAIPFLLNAATLPLQSRAEEANSLSGVLGRTVRLDVLCDDFEDKDWHYDYQKHVCYRGFWRTDDRGEPDLLKHVDTPIGGKVGSTGALEMRTNQNDNDRDPTQDDLLTVEFKDKLGRELTRADQPVFIVRVWLPPFDQWNIGLTIFGFRQTARLNDNSDYYQSIWLAHNGHKPLFFLRNGIAYPNGTQVAFNDDRRYIVTQPGWWTLAIAYDEKGAGHYYASPSTDSPTERNRMVDTTQFRTIGGIDSPFMDHMGYSFFSLGYPGEEKISPRFVIDDYEVWVVKDADHL